MDLAEWKQAGTSVDTDDGTVFVLDFPAYDEIAEPLLVLHGFPSCSFDWRHVLDRFRSRHRVVLFDFLGFGLSDKPDRRYSIDLHADSAEAVIAATGLERFALLSHDMGDTVGGELLARDLEGEVPYEVTQRVLSNGSIYIEMAHLTPGQELLLALDDARVDLGQQLEDPSQAFKSGLASTFAPAHAPDAEELEAQWQLLAHNGGNQLLARTIRYIEDRRASQERFTGAIESHPSPLGVVWGDLDPVAVHPMAHRLCGAREDARLITLDGVGHYPMIETPDRFAEALLELLQG
jgi:pimeloyl-ACP methyl ester carboxylesterase